MTTALPQVFDTVVHMLKDAADRSPASPAIVFENRQLDYGQYWRCVAGFAAELLTLGARGERVVLICGNSLEMAVAMYAVQAAGAQAVPVNPLYTPRELKHILVDADPVAIILDDHLTTSLGPLFDELEFAQRIPVGSGSRLLDTWAENTSVTLAKFPLADDLATLQYTGGTTGLPKGVNITHRQMATNISQREAILPTQANDERILCVMPLFHVFAVHMCLYLAAFCRGLLIILPRYQPETVLAAIEKFQITRFPAGPTVYNGLMAFDGFSATDFSSLRTAWSGSAPLPGDTLKRWQEQTGCPILEGYGQSEAGPVLTYVAEGERIKPGSVGKVLPLTNVQIVDTETGDRILAVGEQGEIRARGPQIMSGYRNREQETAATLRGGWLYTGDIGELDEDGDLYIRDRKKDMAIVGGYNVYPREIDEVLYAHPDVVEAAAIGVADDYRGEVIRAFVVIDKSSVTVDDLLEHCRLNLARYKIPAVLELVNDLPKTPVGKIDKKALRDSTNA
jgi:long-chain acyl-CoA synthetase